MQNQSVIPSSRISQISHSIHCVDKELWLKKQHQKNKQNTKAEQLNEALSLTDHSLLQRRTDKL